MTTIAIRKMDKLYDCTLVLEGINLELNLNEKKIIGLVGANGAGKTTLMKIISGIVYKNKGDILLLEDTEVNYELWAKKNVAYISAGERGLLIQNSIRDNVIYYCALKGISKKEAEEGIYKYSRGLLMEDILDKRIGQISMGQTKKCQILCALCSQRPLILLDEPSIGLDVDTTDSLKRVLQDIQETTETTILVSSHDMHFLANITDTYLFIKKGKLVNTIDSKISMDEIYAEYMKMNSGEGNA